MKILHIYKDYFPVIGGIENHVRLLAESQAAAGHEVTVLVTNRARVTTTERLNGVRVIKAARLGVVASTPLSVSLFRHLRRQRSDVTHLHFPYPVGEVAHYLSGRSRHAVMTYHSDVVRQKAALRLYKPLMWRVLHSVDRIIVGSPNYLASSSTLQRFASKCKVVPYGIDRRPFLNADPVAARRLRELHGGGPLLLFVGVLRYYKGLEYLLEAMTSISAKLLIVGEGPLGSSLRAQARALGLGHKVLLTGRVRGEDLPAYYRAADVFVLPASERSEAFGLVQIEAMTCATPVVCTELGTGTTFVNRHQESGLVVPPKDARALARAINRLLSDEPLRRRLAEGALERSSLFTAERMLAGVRQVYDELVPPQDSVAAREGQAE
jgi:rhamnosyl/mannosyltransferase